MDTGRILDNYPLPVARGYRRYRNASDPRERHDFAYFLFEIYLKYVSSVAIAAYLSSGERDHRVNVVLKGLARPSLGEWFRFLRECSSFLAGLENSDAALRAIAALLTEKCGRWPAVTSLYNRLRVYNTGSESAREQVSLGMLLGEVVGYRNRVIGHGAPLDSQHYEEFADFFGTAFPELLDESPFLTVRRLVSFRSIEVHEGSRIECEVIEYMGLQPVRTERPLVLEYGAAPPVKDQLYLLDEEKETLLLEPLLVARHEDVYILNEADGTPEYLSYSSGERHRPTNFSRAQSELFERILGYRIDEEHLDRFGNDLAAAETAIQEGKGKADADVRRLGDYRIIREVGRGAMGTVYEAFQESLSRRVALKTLPPKLALDAGKLKRFRREAQSMAQVHHPNIIPVYDVGEAGGTHYYTMEFIVGDVLDRVIEKRRRDMPTSGEKGADVSHVVRVVQRAAELAAGLEEIHAHGLVHRDIKPSNILVDRDGRWFLVDFGIVHTEGEATLTQAGELLGTLGYMSPEQLLRGEVDARADVYGLGVTLYEALTLAMPYEIKNEKSLQRAMVFDQPISPRHQSSSINRDLETILLHSLEKNPERRYATAGEFAADLRRFLNHEPIQARPQAAITRFFRRTWKHRRTVAGILVLVAVLLTWMVTHRARVEAENRKAFREIVVSAVVNLPLGSPGVQGDEDEFWPDPVEEAVKDLEDAAKIFPRRPEPHYYIALAERSLGRHDRAGAALARALELDPRFAPAQALRDVLSGLEMQATEGMSSELDSGALWRIAHGAVAEAAWKLAEEAYSRILRQQQRSGASGAAPWLKIEALLGRGRALLELGMKDPPKHDQAIADFATVKSQPELAGKVGPVLLMAQTYLLMSIDDRAESLLLQLYNDSLNREDEREDVALRAAFLYHEVGARRWGSRPWKDTTLADKGLEWATKIAEGPTREFRRMDFLRHKGKLQDAVRVAETAAKKYPKDASVRNQLGNCYLLNRQLEEARDAYTASIGLNSEYPRPYSNLGVVLRRLGDFSGAIKACKQAFKIRPGFAKAHYNLGNIYLNSKDYPMAIAAFKDATTHRPNYARAYNNLGYAYALSTPPDYVKAGAAFKKAFENDPKNYKAFNNYGEVLMRIGGQLKEAVDAFERALKIKSDYTNARTNLARALLRYEEGFDDLRQPGRAKSEAQKAFHAKGNEDPDSQALIALAHFRLGQPAEAVKIAEQAVALLETESVDDEERAQEIRDQLRTFRAALEKKD